MFLPTARRTAAFWSSSFPHCNYAFPSGDPYLVYPGKDGEPLSSIRAEVQSEALVDLRAFQTLEKHLGREAVLQMIDRNAGMEKMTFKNTPLMQAIYWSCGVKCLRHWKKSE